MSLPVSLLELRRERAAFLQALALSPALSAFADLLRDLVDGRPRAEKNAELIRAAAGALPLTEPSIHLTAIVQKRMALAGGWVPDDATIRRVLRKMRDEKRAKPGRESRLRQSAAGTLRWSQLIKNRVST